MPYRKTILLLPCHSLEDFPTHHEGDSAEGLLAAWTATWHPTLLSHTGELPQWLRGDDAPSELDDALVVIPEVTSDHLPTGFHSRAASQAARLIIGQNDRDALLEEMLEGFPEHHELVDRVAPDFLALAYCYLQIEILTRQMRYTSNLDEVHFAHQVVEGAKAAVAGDEAATERLLQQAFDMLAEERDHYYAVDVFLIDLTLIAQTTLGTSLTNALAEPTTPLNLLLDAALLDAMAEANPAAIPRMRALREAGRLGVAGGDPSPRPWPMMGLEAILQQLLQGRRRFIDRLGRAPATYGRYSFGLTPALPQLLTGLGYRGAIHASFDGAATPQGTQSKVRWEGPDGTAIDAIARGFYDASAPETFLGLAARLSEAMDMEHVATFTFVHWPGRTCRWYDDLRRTARFGQPLGRFVTLDEYFGDSDYPGHLESFRPDEYRPTYLQQAVAAQTENPISSQLDAARQTAAQWTRQGLELMAAVLHLPRGGVEDRQLAESLTRRLEGDAPAAGVWLLNPTAHVRRVSLMLPSSDPLPAEEAPVYIAESLEDRHAVVVDVPPMGFVWCGDRSSASDAPSGRRRRAKEPLLAEEGVLRNEFLEAMIHPTTGGIRAVRSYGDRGGRISQQLAFRFGDREDSPHDPHAPYTVMACDEQQVTIASHAVGEIVTRGRLMDRAGDVVATYRQTYRLWRGSRLLEVAVELEPQRLPQGDPWREYYALRFAWADESWMVVRTVNDLRQATSARRIEGTHYIELNHVDQRTTIFPNGLPCHRRIGRRMLDSLLIVPGEECRQFSFALGIDVKHPWQQAAWLQSPPIAIPTDRAPRDGRRSGWLFHVSHKNVTATAWTPIEHDGRTVGLRTRLLETAGRQSATELRAPYELRGARRTDFLGRRETDCPVEGDLCRIDLEPHEWTEVEVWWAEIPGNDRIIITIDGPAGAGKSSVAREVAARLGIEFLDTGAMYRAVALAALQRGIDPNDESALEQLVRQLDVRFDDGRVLLDGEDVTEAIRAAEVTRCVSRVADHPAVRSQLVAWQRAFAADRSVITEGRDQGTVVFPHARLKIFLTASPEERARRRAEQLRRDGIEVDDAEILQAQIERDQRDVQRPVGALVRADDAHEIITDGKSFETVVDEIVALAQRADPV